MEMYDRTKKLWLEVNVTHTEDWQTWMGHLGTMHTSLKHMQLDSATRQADVLQRYVSKVQE